MRKKNETKKVRFFTDYLRIAFFLKFSWEEGEGWPWRPIQTSPIPLLQIKIGSLVECGVLSFYQISESTSSVTAVLIKKFKYEMNFECFVSHSSSHWLKYNGWLLRLIQDFNFFFKFSWEEGEGWPWRPIQTSPIPLLQIKIGSLVECGVLSFYQISESTSSVTAVLIKKFKYEMNFECFVSHSSSHWLKYNGWLLRLIQDFKTVLNLEKLFSFALFLDCFWK